ncbi:MAG: hypothetical protein ACFFDN_12490 [Candidatus Hodarchaeota archaeon]
MKENKIIVLLITIIMGIGLITSSIHLNYAIGPNLEEGNDGFDVTESDILTYKVIAAPMGNLFKVGERFRYTITEINNSLTSFGWIADAVWGKMEYYNSTNGTWGGYMIFPVEEMLICAYNSINANMFPSGLHNFFSIGFPTTFIGYIPPKIPKNFTTANHTIVTEVYHYFTTSMGSSSVFYNSPPNIDGTWSIWTTDLIGIWGADYRYSYTYNENGTCTRVRYDGNPGIGWLNIYDIELEESHEKNDQKNFQTTVLLLLTLMMTGSEGLGIEVIIGITVATIGVFIVLIIIKRPKK